MAKRVSSVGINVEYKNDEKLRVSSIGENIEYIFDSNYLRISAIGVMMEYIFGPYPEGRTQGPALQM